MRRLGLALGACLVVLGATTHASAGVYSHDLSKCLVRSAAPADQKALIVWMFAALGAHPAVRPYVTITTSQQDDVSRQAAELMQRLITVDCRTESVAALKYEGSNALEPAFNVLGQVAVRELMTDPAVAKSIEHLTDYIDKGRIEALGTEAGIATKNKAK